MTSIVRDMHVHQTPQTLDRILVRAVGGNEMQRDPAPGPASQACTSFAGCPLCQTSCRLNRIGTIGGAGRRKWHDTDRQWLWRRQAALDGGGTAASGDHHSCDG